MSIKARIQDKFVRGFRNLLRRRMDDCMTVVRQNFYPPEVSLKTVSPTFGKVEGFHDLAYLFGCSYANRGVIMMDFDEAAYLWKIVAERKPQFILEIGRWLGGSTVLLATAAREGGGEVISIDLKAKTPDYADDRMIDEHLKKIGLKNYRLQIGSSFDFNPGETIDLAFVDGDHSYKGVKQDLLNLRKYLRTGADVLFHDAGASRDYATVHDTIARFMSEMEDMEEWVKIAVVGSIVHFRLK